jgi:hypothetical protein
MQTARTINNDVGQVNAENNAPQIEGELAWSIGFSDVVLLVSPFPSRTPSTETPGQRSYTTSGSDTLLGINDAIVGIEAAATDNTIPAEGKIRGTLILTLALTPTESNTAAIGSINIATISLDPFTSPQTRLVSDVFATNTKG